MDERTGLAELLGEDGRITERGCGWVTVGRGWRSVTGPADEIETALRDLADSGPLADDWHDAVQEKVPSALGWGGNDATVFLYAHRMHFSRADPVDLERLEEAAAPLWVGMGPTVGTARLQRAHAFDDGSVLVRIEDEWEALTWRESGRAFLNWARKPAPVWSVEQIKEYARTFAVPGYQIERADDEPGWHLRDDDEGPVGDPPKLFATIDDARAAALEQLAASLPDRLRSLRYWHNLNQTDAANLLGVPLRTLQSWEADQRPQHVAIVGRAVVALSPSKKEKADRERARQERLAAIHAGNY